MRKEWFVLALRKYNPLLNWGVFSSEYFTTESVTQGLSKVNTLPQPVSCSGPCDGTLSHSQPTSRPASEPLSLHQTGRQRDRQGNRHTGSKPVNQPASDSTSINPVDQLVSRSGKSVTARGDLALTEQHTCNANEDVHWSPGATPSRLTPAV